MATWECGVLTMFLVLAVEVLFSASTSPYALGIVIGGAWLTLFAHLTIDWI
jgi:hypothetical protein